MARLGVAGLALLLLLLVVPSAAEAVVLPSGFKDEIVIDELEEPTAFRFSPDGRVFVAEKQGKILVYDNLGDPTPTEFADLRTQVYDRGDRGLLGMALDPEFGGARPYVYALYTYDHLLGEADPAPRWGLPDHTGDECEKPAYANVDACPVSGRLVRLTAVGDHAEEAGGEPVETTLVEDWCQQNSSHSVGSVEFGPEGALYAGAGDGASFIYADWGQANWPEPNLCGDPPEPAGTALELPTAEGGSLRAQNPRNLDGSIIRVDPDTGMGWPGNPLSASPDANERRIVAYGMRNPYRFTMHPGTGEVYVGNVGGSLFEEIDRFDPQSGQVYNSGWPCYEGPEREYLFKALEPLPDVCETLYDEVEGEGLEPVAQPFFDYSHHGGVAPEDGCPRIDGSAISGLRFYEGESFPDAYDGALFFADTVRGCIYVMRADEDGEPDPLTVEPFATEDDPYPGIDVENGPGGDLYYTSLFGPGYTPGAVHRVSYLPGAPTARLSATPKWGPLPLDVELDAGGSSDPEEEALSYEWDLDESGGFEPGTAQESLHLDAASNRTVTVRVGDEQGHTSVAQVTVYPGDAPPAVTIESPDAEALRWRVGQEVHFSGSAVEEGGSDEELPATSLYWHARLYHCPTDPDHCHAHPLQVFPGVDFGSFPGPDHDYPSHVELSLTATDSRGLTATTAVQLQPRVVGVPVASQPPGVTLSAGLRSEPAPFMLEAIEGSQVQLSAPGSAELGGTQYRWVAWSDGGAPTHIVVGGEPAPPGGYVATYEAVSGEEPDEGPLNFASPRDTTPKSMVRRVVLRRHPPRRTRSRRARFAFRATGSALRFLCKIDRRAYRRCRSPRVYRHLRLGRHAFRVQAVFRGGTRSKSVTYRWRVLHDGAGAHSRAHRARHHRRGVRR